jgi:hypothetical protein
MKPFDLNVSPDWEINFGVGWGVTRPIDHLIIKAIIGGDSIGRRRLHERRRSAIMLRSAAIRGASCVEFYSPFWFS